MINRQKIAPRLFLVGLIALPLVASCGLRGGLARPDPLFKDVKPVEAVQEEVQAPVRQSVITRERVNAFGGEIPDAAPTDPVISAPITDPVSTDDKDE